MIRALAVTGLCALVACANATRAGCRESQALRSEDEGAANRRCAPTLAGAAAPGASGGVALTPAEYCAPDNGFAVGARGEAYAGLCSGPQAQAFLARYAAGERLFELERAAIAASYVASDAAKELWRVKRRIMQVETLRISTSTPAAQRADLARELKALLDEKSELESALDGLQKRKDLADSELMRYRDGLAAQAAPDDRAAGPTRASYERP
jgi:hypothetical protein